MRANVAVKTIDRMTASPMPDVTVELGTSMYSLKQVTDPYGTASFIIDIGGDEVGRHPEEGIAILLSAFKNGYVNARDRFMCFGNKATILQMERI